MTQSSEINQKKEDRLAAALRENLKKRKQQQRERTQAQKLKEEDRPDGSDHN
jgi:tRNA A37 threonylcarbamoyladenosine dehydratase